MDAQFNFETFYKDTFRQALHYAKRYMIDEEDAKDVVSDAYLKILEMGARVDLQLNVRALLFSIIHNKSMDLSYRSVRYKKVLGAMKLSASEMGRDECDAFCERELYSMACKAINHLPADQRQALVELRLNKCSYKEVSAMMNVTVRSLEYKVKVATQTLRKQLPIAECV